MIHFLEYISLWTIIWYYDKLKVFTNVRLLWLSFSVWIIYFAFQRKKKTIIFSMRHWLNTENRLIDISWFSVVLFIVSCWRLEIKLLRLDSSTVANDNLPTQIISLFFFLRLMITIDIKNEKKMFHCLLSFSNSRISFFLKLTGKFIC